jgi:ferredoxin
MTDYRVGLLPARWRFQAGADRTILASAEAAGITLPSSCRNGSCRTCMCQMEEGSVHYLIEWPGLSREEKAEGWILPCVALPLADLLLQVPAARRADAESERPG